MRIAKRSLLVGLLTTVIGAAPAWATHNHPASATIMTLPLVSAYEYCGSSFDVPSGETQSPNPQSYQNPATTLPACAPAPYSSKLQYGPKGTGKVTLSVKKGRTTEDIKMVVKLTDVRDPNNGNMPYTSGTNCTVAGAHCLQVLFLFRLTDNSCTPPPTGGTDCTVLDGLPVNYNTDLLPLVPCKNGTCTLTTTVNSQIPNTVNPNHQGNLEIRNLEIDDWSTPSLPLFKPGLYLP